jgi:hypothetical protein
VFSPRVAVGYDIVAGHVNTLRQDIIMYHFASNGNTDSSKQFPIYRARVTVPFPINGSHFLTFHHRSFRTDRAAFPPYGLVFVTLQSVCSTTLVNAVCQALTNTMNAVCQALTNTMNAVCQALTNTMNAVCQALTTQ